VSHHKYLQSFQAHAAAVTNHITRFVLVDRCPSDSTVDAVEARLSTYILALVLELVVLTTLELLARALETVATPALIPPELA
jgi:hypothetical protein